MRTGLAVLACLLILISGGGLGAWAAGRLRRRAEFLAGAGAGVDSLMRDMEQLALPLPEALAQAARCAGPAGELFAMAGRILQSGEGVTGGEAWLEAVEQGEFSRDCQPLLAEVGAGLGETDVRAQLRQLLACRSRLEQGRAEAEREYARLGRIWRALGWCGGAVLVLLLL